MLAILSMILDEGKERAKEDCKTQRERERERERETQKLTKHYSSDGVRTKKNAYRDQLLYHCATRLLTGMNGRRMMTRHISQRRKRLILSIFKSDFLKNGAWEAAENLTACSAQRGLSNGVSHMP